MAARQNSTEPRWTPAQIRKAIKCPKPESAISKARQYELGTAWRPSRSEPADIRLLRWIANNADIIGSPIPHELGGTCSGSWVLVPLPKDLLDALARFEADSEDLESEFDLEDGGDDEPEVEGDDCDEEESDQPAVRW